MIDETQQENAQGAQYDDSQHGGLFDSQKEKIMSGLDAFSAVIKNTTDELRKDGATSVIADYAEKLGGNMGEVKEWVNNLNFDSALQATRDFARRRPEVVLLGMFGAGLLVGRFLKSAGSLNLSSSTERKVKGFPLENREVH